MNKLGLHENALVEQPAIDLLQSATEWATWLLGQEATAKTVYLTKPERLIADYYGERGCSRDYEGREILELLQNASDAAAELDQVGRVLIKLLPEGLIIANTGAAFTRGGIESLQTSNLSPKRRSRRPLIGSKGLGFRAILNWSRFPMILSGGLGIAYTEEYARTKLQELMTANSALASLVQEEATDGGDLIISLLAFPGFCEDGGLRRILHNKAAQSIFDHCEKLRTDGYTTAIGMPFDRPKAYEHANSQLASLRPELLLFVRFLGEITICVGDTQPQVWRRNEEFNPVNVCINNQPYREWDVHTQNGSVPTEHLDEGVRNLDYEIVVAIPTGAAQKPLPLFSFFPTDIRLPLPLVCHATLDLQQNRQHARDTNANRYVLSQLTSLLADLAEKHGLTHPDKPWAACDLLIAEGDFGSDLERVDFRNQLVLAAKTKRIVPTLSDKRELPKDARRVSFPDRSWLPLEQFGDVTLTANLGRYAFLLNLDVPELTNAELAGRLRKITNLSLDARTNLIAGLIRNEASPETKLPSLLLDGDGRPVPDDARIFMAPSSGQIVPLPSWVEIRFLNEELRAKLALKLAIKDARSLQMSLSDFHVVEYALDNLVSSLVAATNRRVKMEPQRIAEYAMELLKILFQLFISINSEKALPQFPQSGVRLPTQAGTWTDSRTLYLGASYPPFGRITQDLFKGWNPGKLVAPVETFQLAGNAETVARFLCWLGVESWPRETTETPKTDFLDFVLRSIKYPAQFNDYTFEKASYIPSPSIKSAKSIEGLSSILEKADPQAIVAWLANDGRAYEWQRDRNDYAELWCSPYRVKHVRDYSGVMPSYVRWLIRRTSWLPLAAGGKGKPSDCIIADRAIETLFPRPQSPTAEIMAKYGLTAATIRDAWIRAGVMPGLAYLDREDIYRLLLELPERNPDGQSARALYRWLLEAEDSAMGDPGPSMELFRKEGKMWGRHGTTSGYFPIQELRHADAEDLPEALLTKLKIVDLPKRVGADKVERVFSVQPVEKGKIGKQVEQHQLAIGHTEVVAEFQDAKPYLFALRQSQTTQAQNLTRLRELKLWICSTVVASVDYEGELFDYELGVWEWLMVDQGLFVRVDPVESASLTSDLLADSIGAAVASLFRLGDGGDFARLLHCQPKDRDRLLRRMRGETNEENLDVLKQQFALKLEDEPQPLNLPQVSTLVSSPAQPNPPAAPDMQITVSGTSGTTAANSSPILEIVEQPRQVLPPPTYTALRVQRPSQPGFRISVQIREVADWQFCEKKAMEFELSDEPPRFPLLVSSIQGYNAPGCDILSFENVADRERFLAAEVKDGRLVKRFIEVKARSTERARITLKGNELTAAERFQDRYFLYRLFEEDDGNLILAVLKHPLGATEAIDQSVEVSLERAKDTRKFRLTGGISKTTATSWDGKELPALPSAVAPVQNP